MFLDFYEVGHFRFSCRCGFPNSLLINYPSIKKKKNENCGKLSGVDPPRIPDRYTPGKTHLVLLHKKLVVQ